MGDYGVTVLAAGEDGSSNFLVPNGTFFFVLAIFLVVLGVIAVFVVPPIMIALREREYMVAETLSDNKVSDEEIAGAREDFEAVMSTARTEASGIRDETRAEGRRMLEEMRARASDDARQALKRVSERLKQQADAMAAKLRATVERMSRTLARRILGVDRASGTRSAATGGQGSAEKSAAEAASGR
jgi:F-type H+-transporting ATPase subunit b